MAEFGAGLIVGVLAGFFLYPLFWSWIAWREYRESSRRTRRIDDVLADMTPESLVAESRQQEKRGRRISRPRSLWPIGR